jgi:hypothetical protein
MDATAKSCPFKVGDTVIYRPSERGWGYEVMHVDNLVPGAKYVVAEIKHGVYLVVQGHIHPSGGHYWTEFEHE